MTASSDSSSSAGAPYIRIECERCVDKKGRSFVRFVATDMRNGEREVMQVAATESELLSALRDLAIAFAIRSKLRLDDYHGHDLETARPAGWRTELRRQIAGAIERALQ